MNSSFTKGACNVADPKPPKPPTAPGTKSDRDADVIPMGLKSLKRPSDRVPEPKPHPAVAAGVRVTERVALPTMVPEEVRVPVPPRLQAIVPADRADEVAPVRMAKVVIERIKAPTKSELSWMRVRVLGNRAKVFHLPDGTPTRYAGYAAAMIRSFEESPEGTTVFVRVRFSPDLGPTWDHKLRARRRERYEQLKGALGYALARVQLTPGLVLRFAGVPAMSQAEAQRNGYHVWLGEDRAAVVSEWTSDFIVAHRRKLTALHTEVASGNSLVRLLKLAWWGVFDRERLSAYHMGARIARSGDTVTSTTRGVQVFETSGSMTVAAGKVAKRASEIAAPVVQSLVSLAFGESSKYRSMMVEEGISTADVQGTRLGTLVDEESLYVDDEEQF